MVSLERLLLYMIRYDEGIWWCKQHFECFNMTFMAGVIDHEDYGDRSTAGCPSGLYRFVASVALLQDDTLAYMNYRLSKLWKSRRDKSESH